VTLSVELAIFFATVLPFRAEVKMKPQ